MPDVNERVFHLFLKLQGILIEKGSLFQASATHCSPHR